MVNGNKRSLKMALRVPYVSARRTITYLRCV